MTVSLIVLTVDIASAGPKPDGDDSGRRRGSANGIGGFAGVVPAAPEQTGFAEVFALDRASLDAACPTAIPVEMRGAGAVDIRCPTASTTGGVAHIAAGIGLRNRGSGTIALRLAPSDAETVFAELYVSVIFDVQPPGQLPVIFNGQLLTADLVSSAPAPCWTGIVATGLYRTSVLAHVPPSPNGDYTIACVPSAVVDGSSPYLDEGAAPLAAGASLVVGYVSEQVPPDSITFLHEDQIGGPVLDDGLTVDHALSRGVPVWSSLLLSTIGADGQPHDGVGPLAPVDTDLSSSGSTLRIRGEGSAIELTPDWLGHAAPNGVHLWDTRTTEIFANPSYGELLSAGSTAYSLIYTARQGASCAAQAFGAGPAGEPNKAPNKAPTTFDYDCVNVQAHVLTVCGLPE